MANGKGMGRMGGGGVGPGGECVCHACGHREPHQQGQPCNPEEVPEMRAGNGARVVTGDWRPC
jgi:hypothetical protein